MLNHWGFWFCLYESLCCIALLPPLIPQGPLCPGHVPQPPGPETESASIPVLEPSGDGSGARVRSCAAASAGASLEPLCLGFFCKVEIRADPSLRRVGGKTKPCSP